MLVKIEKTLINPLRIKWDSNRSKKVVEHLLKSEQQIKEPIN